jgi:hypothetical protein
VPDDRFPLSRSERLLQQRVQAHLPPDEQVLAAIQILTGPRPGMEGCMAPLAVFDLVLAVLSIFGLAVSRKNFTLAITDKRGVLFRDNWIGRPATIAATFSNLDDIGPLNDTDGDPFVMLSGEKFWMYGAWSSQLYRIRKIKQARKSPSPPA